MEIKDKIDIIAKKLDIIKSKAIGFMAMGGGSWIYAFKDSQSDFITLGAWILFTLSAIGVIINFLKMGNLYTELEEITK
jgi:hypothetical protein